VLIDKADGFVFGFSKLDVMFGRTAPQAVRHPYRDLVKPGVRFVQTAIRSIDPVQRRVETDAGAFDADVMKVALGADLDPSATPGLAEAGHEFYTVDGAFAAQRSSPTARRCRSTCSFVDAGQLIARHGQSGGAPAYDGKGIAGLALAEALDLDGCHGHHAAGGRSPATGRPHRRINRYPRTRS
jgi:hypothetical protein